MQTINEFELIPFVENPDPRCAAVLVLDCSSSMSTNNAIGQLNDGVQTLHSCLTNDELASRRIELGVISFGSKVSVESTIAPLDVFSPPTLRASGSTPLAQAVLEAISMVEERTKIYQKAGIAYYKPWILLMTDGGATDDRTVIEEAINKSIAVQESGLMTVFAVGVEQADFGLLDLLTYKFNPKKMSGVKWNEFFIWLSNSLRKISASNTSDKIALDKTSDWEM